MTGQKKVQQDLFGIFAAGVRRVDPDIMIRECVSLSGQTLGITHDGREEPVSLEKVERILVLGAGKAGAAMARGLEAVLRRRISLGLVVVKEGHTGKLETIKLLEASHPVPDERSVHAAGEIRALAQEGDEHTLFINLISGGGSALLCLPYQDDRIRLSLKDKQKTTQLLLECGASIQEINSIRKHISGIKGGRLAASMYPARSINLILSDVIGDRLDAIASGPTSPDTTTFETAQAIIRKYQLEKHIPEQVRNVLSAGVAGEIPDTPKEGDVIFSQVHNIVIGSNYLALEAARNHAEKLGYNTVILTSTLSGEAKECAKMFHAIGTAIKTRGTPLSRPACVLAGGETTVTIRGSGRGGRNQEMALSFLCELTPYPEEAEGIYFLSGGTDGNDGPTDAAGAAASIEVLREAERQGLDPEKFLRNNDSYPFFEQAGGLLKTGPTNTNVCDIQVLLVP